MRAWRDDHDMGTVRQERPSTQRRPGMHEQWRTAIPSFICMLLAGMIVLTLIAVALAFVFSAPFALY